MERGLEGAVLVEEEDAGAEEVLVVGLDGGDLGAGEERLGLLKLGGCGAAKRILFLGGCEAEAHLV